MSDQRGPKPGEFPFRILSGEQESRYVTWVRNNSSFLQLSGVLGALQGLTTYVRGVIGNLIILTPVLFVLGLLLGSFHFWMLENPFWITKWLVAASLLLVLGYYAFRSADTSYAQPTMLAGRIGFWLVFAFVMECSPHVIEYFRSIDIFKNYGPRESTSIIVGLASGAGVLTRFIPKSSSLLKTIMIGLLAILAFGLTWMVLSLIHI